MEIAKGWRVDFLVAEIVRLNVPAGQALIVETDMALRFMRISAAGSQTAIAQEDAHMLVTFVILVPVRVVTARLPGDAMATAATDRLHVGV